MPDLAESLQGRDLGHFRIIAELWGIEFNVPDARAGLQRLAAVMLDKGLLWQGVADLTRGAREALDDLYQNQGRLPWPLFTRRYGAVREMGAGKRDRERPYLKPANPAEVLWYRALVARTFFDTPAGAQEFAYIPSDLLPLLPVPQDMLPVPLGRPATPAEQSYAIPASDAILDHACTLLAGLRLGLSIESISFSPYPPSSPFPLSPPLLKLLLSSASLLDENGLPRPDPARAFLEAGRGDALAQLTGAWSNSTMFNDLRLVPGLLAEGEWVNDPLSARRAILEFLKSVPGRGGLPTIAGQEGEPRAGRRETLIGDGQEILPGGEGESRLEVGSEARPYWNIDSFVAGVREKYSDFQRPAGDYDSWFIRGEGSGGFLRGFEHWNEVDGALIRFVLCGPLHWLGILDLAAPAADAPATAFRFSDWAAALLGGSIPAGLREEDEPVLIRSDGRLSISRKTPRAVRYQAARFCDWEGEKDGNYRYRITPFSLRRARQQGLTIAHLVALLAHNAPAIPPNLANALKRWEQQGSEARIEPALVLRLSSPDLLLKLRNSRAARFLGDPLGPAAVIVKPGAGQKVLDVLAEMGILGELVEEDQK